MWLNKNGYREIAFFSLLWPCTKINHRGELSNMKYIIAKHEIIIKVETTKDIFPFCCQDVVLIFTIFLIHFLKG